MKDTIPKPPHETCRENPDFRDWVLKVAAAREWKVNRVWTTKNERGIWITTCSPGWPDLTLVRGPRLVFMELKTKNGRVEPKQDEWLDALAGVPFAEVWVVDPTMASTVIDVLR